MQVETRPSEGSPAHSPPGHGDLRAGGGHPWRRAIAITLAALVIAFGVYVARYMPLIPPNGVAGGQGRTDLGSFESPGGETFGVGSYAYQDGKTFYFGFGLHNNGPLPITVTGIHTQGVTSSSSLTRETVWMADKDGWYGPPGSAGGRPFHSFSLGKGDERWIVFSERMVNCSKYDLGAGASSTQTLARADVSYRVLGFVPRHAVMPYDETTQVILSGGTPCP